MSEFWPLWQRLQTNPHEYTSLNAITRLIAERVGYRIERGGKRGEHHFYNVTAPDGTTRTLSIKHSDLDRAWQDARLRHLLPDYMRSTDAALTLWDHDQLHVTTTLIQSDDSGHTIFAQDENGHGFIECTAKKFAHAVCGVWWGIMTGEHAPLWVE